MTLRRFVPGTVSYETAKKPAGQDFYFVGCTLLAFGVVAGIGVTIYRWWTLLLSNSYSPAPLVLLMTIGVYLCWDWTRIARQREQLAQRAKLIHTEDPNFQQLLQQALVNLYRGFFLMCMLVLLLMMLLHLLIHPGASPNG